MGRDIQPDARYWIEKLNLEPHPEGGYYRQTYRSQLLIEPQALAPHFPGTRPVSTAIYFLLDDDNFSALHRLRSDEMWHFYLGDPLVVHAIDPDGTRSDIMLGSGLAAGQVPQAVVKAGCWFGSRLMNGGCALVGCTVAPGFDFNDFELAKRDELTRLYPQHRELIEQLTRS
jgi:predicted cupin superfamily sugar epimerase